MASLKRFSDGKTGAGKMSNAIEWNDDKTFKCVKGKRPIVGCSMLVGESMVNYWLTTVITEIVEDNEDYVKFKTKNSVYEWKK